MRLMVQVELKADNLREYNIKHLSLCGRSFSCSLELFQKMNHVIPITLAGI